MNRSALNLVLAMAAAGLLGLVAWQLATRKVPDPVADQRSDYVLRDFELVALDGEGTESFTVTGPHLQRDPAGKSLTLDQPRFSFPGRDGRWNARSDTAWVSPDADEVHLRDRVRLVGPRSEAGLQTRFSTASLVVFPDEQRATGDRAVTITQGDSILAGTGLAVDMRARRFQLLSDVKGRYVPRP